MTFPSVVDLRATLNEYTIQNRVAIKYAKNDLQRVRAHCAEGCPWFIFAAPDSRTKIFVVKRYVGTHTCERVWQLKQFTAKYLSKRYLEKFRADDKMTLMIFSNLVQQEYHMTTSRSKLARARRIAMKQIHGDEEKQFDMLWDFSAEVRRSNPGSSMFMMFQSGCFSSLYMSLYACKAGFLRGCRPIICVDGCHIKTKYGGQLLTAVGLDPNDCIFPIAMAYVEVEDTETWKWFFRTLIKDLGIQQNTTPWTIMSDRQKGLINALKSEFPHSEHRFCVRHLYQNFNNQWKGEILKNKLWAIARSYNLIDWRKNMDEMKELNLEAYEYLEAIDPHSQCRAHFSELSKCDLLLNNTCEVFNKYILYAREMPVLSMFQKIKNQLMTMFSTKNEELEEMPGPVCPKIRGKKLVKLEDLANNCYLMEAGKGIFNGTGLTGQYQVDILKQQCSCRKWQMTCIPCHHSITCFRHERISPESMVHTCYSVANFKLCYSEVIMPCKDPRGWQKMNAALVMPPVCTKKVGRPPTKRRKAPEEKNGKLTRAGSVQHCSVCNQPDHNKRKCPELGRGGQAVEQAHVQPEAHVQAEDHQQTNRKRKQLVKRDVTFTQESGTTSIGENGSQISMLDLMLESASQSTKRPQIPLGPLPECGFIANTTDAWPQPRPLWVVPPAKKKAKGKAKGTAKKK